MTLAAVRDVALILLALESIVLGVLAALLIVRLLTFIERVEARLEDMSSSAGDVLESAREAATAANQAAAQVRGSTAFLSDQVVLPAIRTAAAVNGAARFARALLRPPRTPRRRDRNGSARPQ